MVPRGDSSRSDGDLRFELPATNATRAPPPLMVAGPWCAPGRDRYASITGVSSGGSAAHMPRKGIVTVPMTGPGPSRVLRQDLLDVLNLSKLNALIDALAGTIHYDKALNPLDLAAQLRNLAAGDVQFFTIPLTPAPFVTVPGAGGVLLPVDQAQMYAFFGGLSTTMNAPNAAPSSAPAPGVDGAAPPSPAGSGRAAGPPRLRRTPTASTNPPYLRRWMPHGGQGRAARALCVCPARLYGPDSCLQSPDERYVQVAVAIRTEPLHRPHRRGLGTRCGLTTSPRP